MKLVLWIEHAITGPLAHRKTRELLENAVNGAATLDDAAASIPQIPGLSVYRGGDHVAIHPIYNGKFAHGSDRLAIVTAARRSPDCPPGVGKMQWQDPLSSVSPL